MSRQPAVLALDQGTTGSTALVIAADGSVRGRGYSEFTQYFPRPGWVEHDAREIWDVTRAVAGKAVAEAGDGVDLRAIGITNQRETLVVWDRETLDPVHRAIVWQDRRTTGICQELRDRGSEEGVRARTGLLFDPYFTGTKLTWLFREDDGLRRRAESGELAAGTIDSWLIARLTGGRHHVTDPTNASRTLLYELDSGRWGGELLDLLEVPAGLLPEIVPSSGRIAVSDGATFGMELPISGVAGDQQSALFGQGCWESGLAKSTYGTGAFLLMHTGSAAVRSDHGLLTTVACGPDGGRTFALEGSVFIAGAAIQWLRDQMGFFESSPESESLAASIEDNDGVYFVPAFVGLGAPHWEPAARGMITGLTRGTGRAHVTRAALESIAYSVAEVLAAMERDSSVSPQELRVDGGASRNDWLMSFQAGVTGVPVRRPQMVETTALGAAGLAGIAEGVWRDGEEFLGSQATPTVFEPHLGSERRDALKRGWDRAVRAARGWAADDT